ncbi:MAG TPA: FG-GAP-like repeat-containing protein, partial [Planctomycetota bacterium]|nr:FG-GAP-like repeat-containing protein [Planctomycetota bacterium]
MNGDGLSDLLIGAPLASPKNLSGAGEAFLLFGRDEHVPAQRETLFDKAQGISIRGVDIASHAGRSVSGGADVNGDGLDDLVVTAYAGPPSDRERPREVFVVFGSRSLSDVDVSDLREGIGGFTITSEIPARGLEPAVLTGDVNGDGLADILIGAPLMNVEGMTISGLAYVVFGKADGVHVDLADVRDGRGGFAIESVTEGNRLGERVAAAGDVNGDGLADLFLASRGSSYVAFGKRDTELVRVETLEIDRAGFEIVADHVSSFGSPRIVGPGDVNGDGLADLLVDARFLVFGKRGFEPVSLAALVPDAGLEIRPSISGDPWQMSGAGDINGDGLRDMVLGAHGSRIEG